MFGKIIYIGNNMAHVEIGANVSTDIMNMHVIFEKDDVKILGEVEDIDQSIVKIKLLGEFLNGKLVGGLTRKPSLDSNLRIIDPSEVPALLGDNDENSLLLGSSPYYNNSNIYINVNKMLAGRRNDSERPEKSGDHRGGTGGYIRARGDYFPGFRPGSDGRLRRIPGAADLHFHQSGDYESAADSRTGREQADSGAL